MDNFLNFRTWKTEIVKVAFNHGTLVQKLDEIILFPLTNTEDMSLKSCVLLRVESHMHGFSFQAGRNVLLFYTR